MDALQAIRERKSYRSTFKSTPIPREDLREIVEAGFLAPSGCNMQTTRFIAVDDPEIARKLGEIYGAKWAMTAPAAILVLFKRTTATDGAYYHTEDFAAATENILIAIAAKGYATTWIEGQIRKEDKAKQIAELLHIPDELTIAVYLPLGIPDSTVKPREKMSFDERVWFNNYGGK